MQHGLYVGEESKAKRVVINFLIKIIFSMEYIKKFKSDFFLPFPLSFSFRLPLTLLYFFHFNKF